MIKIKILSYSVRINAILLINKIDNIQKIIYLNHATKLQIGVNILRMYYIYTYIY